MNIWSVNYNGTSAENRILMNTSINIAYFGIDDNNELYISTFDGNIYRFEEIPISSGIPA